MKLLFRIGFPLLALSMLAAIYVVKYETWRLKREARQLQTQINKERRDITILRAEWAYLTRPHRIEHLARQHLQMRPPAPEQIIVVDD